MQAPEQLARQNIEFFIEKHPLPRPGWTVSSKWGHHTVRVREVGSGPTFGRRFDVLVSHRSGTVSALYERLGNGALRTLKPQRLDWLMACIQRIRPLDVGRIGQKA